MRRPATFWCLFAIWAFGATFLFANLEVKTDSNFLLPRFASPETRLVADQLRRGPASNIVLIGLGGASKDALVQASDRLTTLLRENPDIGFVANGRSFVDPAAVAWARRYRYLLGPPLEPDEFGAASLGRAFKSVLASLGTSAGLLGEDLLFADPTGRMLRILAHFSQQDAPRASSGIWMTADGAMATLVVRPRFDPLDLDGQARAIAAIRSSFQTVQRALGVESQSNAKLTMLVSGPGVFAVDVRAQVISELAWISTATLACSVLLIWFAFRSIAVMALLTFATGIGLTAGVLAVRVVFGEVHGVTVTFGMMLTGLAIDYPIHVLVHGGNSSDPIRGLRSIWSTLLLSALTTLAAFVPFTTSSFPGLAQLGVVSIAGILATFLVARFLLPHFLKPAHVARLPFGNFVVPKLSSKSVRAVQLAGAGIVAAMVAWLVIGDGKVWEDSLANLSPLPREQLETDLRLRRSLQSTNPRFLMVVAESDREAVLERIETLGRRFDELVAQKRLAGYDSPSRYLPSRKAQHERKAVMPPDGELRARVAAALAGTPFREGAFDQFVADVGLARSGDTFLTYEAVAESLFGVRLATLLFRHEGRWAGLVVFQGETVPTKEIEEMAKAVGGSAILLDLKAQADGLLAEYRIEALRGLALGALLSLAVLAIGLRDRHLVARAFAPVACAVALTSVTLLLLGIPLSLFHLMALSVVTGLGYDYALFLDRLRPGRAADSAIAHALVLCATTTIGSYAILSLSQLPILNGIGITVAIGCLLVLIVSALFWLGAGREAPK